MIDVKTYEENNCRKYQSTIQGTIIDISKDAAYIVRGVYDAINENCQEDAESFRECLIKFVNDPLFWTLDNSADESLRVDLSDIKSGGPA